MGNQISVADILFVTCLDSAIRYDLPLPEYLLAYHKKLTARSAYIKSKEDNHEG